MVIEIFWAVCLAGFSSILLAAFLSKRAPKLLSGFLGYGKHQRTDLVKSIPIVFVPKSYFKVFYAIGLPWTAVVFYSCLMTCVAPAVPSYVSHHVLSVCKWLSNVPSSDGDAKSSSISSADCLVGLALLVMQGTRRLYEELFVLKSSPTAKMQTYLFAYGILFYVFLPPTIVDGSPLIADTPVSCPSLSVAQCVRYGVAAVLFAWASYHQHACHAILAGLRRPGESKYGVPHGDWFRYVSSPHYLAECLVYGAVGLVVAGHHTWWLVMAVVVTSLSYVALQTHDYYLTKFKGYPTTRKAIIPFLI